MRQKAEQGFVTGGKVFGYDNLRVGKGHAEWRVNDAERAVVVDIYERFAAGEGARSIAGALNRQGIPSPRAQQGRPSGWSASTIKAVLERPLYRGEIVYGVSRKAYGRELGKQPTNGTVGRSVREKGMIALAPEDGLAHSPTDAVSVTTCEGIERLTGSARVVPPALDRSSCAEYLSARPAACTQANASMATEPRMTETSAIASPGTKSIGLSVLRRENGIFHRVGLAHVGLRRRARNRPMGRL